MDEAVGSDDRSDDQAPDESTKKPMPLWQETILLLGLALILAIIIKSLFVQAFYIPSPSMEPQFVKNDRILVQKVSYWGGASPSRGDIVVFKDPGGWLSEAEAGPPHSPVTRVMEKIGLYPTGGHLVKRVIGVGGDRVVCCDAKGQVTVNGQRAGREGLPAQGHRAFPDRVRHHRPQGPPLDDGRQPRVLLRLALPHGRSRRRATSTRTSSWARCSR